MGAMRSFKLVGLPTALTDAYDCSVLFHSQDFPEAQAGDIIEIYHPDCTDNRALFQARLVNDNQVQKLSNSSMGVSAVVAKKFNLHLNREVYAVIMPPTDVAIELLELTFREQYLSRGDMWCVRNYLLGSCAHLGQRLEIYKFIKVVIDSMWSKGERVKCGCITDDTRISFRSQTAQVNIFIQMSREMWEFDRFGYLYFEKTVDGFLNDLFTLWRENQCNHDVTITLFSRSFYDAKSLNDFPELMRESISVDSRGRFYEDFYRVVVQNERSDDWLKSKTINTLKILFQQYNDSVFHYHETGAERLLRSERDNETPVEWNPRAAMGFKPKPSDSSKTGSGDERRIPRAYNSAASDGNLLEVLNLALNVYEKYHIDRCFDRTGKLSIVLTPGAGIFEVDRRLANITKQRTIDCGSSSDLVCLADQPMHAVPLFKYYSRGMPDDIMDYSIPHWINHSFYTWSAHILTYGSADRFVHVPKRTAEHGGTIGPLDRLCAPLYTIDRKSEQIDYDGYDDQVFRKSAAQKVPMLAVGNNSEMERRPRLPPFTIYFSDLLSTQCQNRVAHRSQHRDSLKASSVYLSHSYRQAGIGQVNVDAPISSFKLPCMHHRVGEEVFGRPLVNPFAPSKLYFKVTANRRRWVHAFPTDVKGKTVQLHHQPRIEITSDVSGTSPATPRDHLQMGLEQRIRQPRRSTGRRVSECSDNSGHISRAAILNGSGSPRDSALQVSKAIAIRRDNDGGLNDSASNNVNVCVASSASSSVICGNWLNHVVQRAKGLTASSNLSDAHNWCWGVTGEQEWTVEMRTGMDWKSMAIPVILPTTTDFFPDRRSLDTAYETHNYTITPEVLNIDLPLVPGRNRITTAKAAFDEMILQRLAQGFQIVLPSKKPVVRMTGSVIRASSSGVPSAETVLSIGCIFHILTVIEPAVHVKMYSPLFKFQSSQYPYKYRYRVPDLPGGYSASETKFFCEPREKFRWNYVDQYLGTRGEDRNFKLIEPVKYWRARFVLLPKKTTLLPAIVDRCDIYYFRNPFSHVLAIEGLLRFLEVANKLNRFNAHAISRRDLLLNLVYVAAVSDPVSVFFNVFVDNGKEFLPSMSPAKVIRNPVGDKKAELEGFKIPTSPASPPPIDVHAVDELIQQAVNEMEHGSGEWSRFISSRLENVAQPKIRKQLTLSSSRSEIIGAMCNSNDGLSFVQKMPNAICPPLPENCFISVEAVLWAIYTVEGIDTLTAGIDYMQRLLADGIICHASGDQQFRFIYGFYLYFVVTRPGSVFPPDPGFEWEWCEVAIKQNTRRNVPAYVAMFVDDPLPLHKYETCQQLGRPLRKEVHVEITPDPTQHPETAVASDRQEYGNALYHRAYSPDGAFELLVEWMVATGPFLYELINSWSRKAGTSDMEFLPAPEAPFALPLMESGDPLRAPIFIPLNLACLCDSDGADPFAEFSPESRAVRVMLLQCSIADCFGFLRDRPPTPGTVGGVNLDESWAQFVHCSGNMFIMIPLLSMGAGKGGGGGGGSVRSTSSRAESMYRDFIACQSQHVDWGGRPEDKSVGFLLGWNFMLSKRWRTVVTGDELFQDRLLIDFRQFCTGSDGRLQQHWQRARVISDAFNKFNQLLEDRHTLTRV